MSWNEVGANSNSGSNGEKTEFLKLEGTVTVRVMDNEPRTYWSHWVPQINGGKGGSVDCIGRGCPVCKILAEDKKNGLPKKYSSSKRHMINVLDRASNSIKILDAGETVFDGLKQNMVQMGDLKNYDVLITKTGTAKQTKYSVLPKFPPYPLTDAEKSMKLYDLESVRKPLTEEQIIQLLSGKSYKDIFQSQEQTDSAPDFSEE